MARKRTTGYMACLNELWLAYKNTSRRKDVFFDIDFDSFLKLIFNPCHYCDAPAEHSKNFYRQKVKYNGIDRKDNFRSYTSDNIVSCCPTCNKIKSNVLDYQEMLVLRPALRLISRMRIDQEKAQEAKLLPPRIDP
jgi:hypothetical protein